MILMAFAAAALAQWTGPRTVEYHGPGYFCGGGYAVMLGPSDRALVLPQGHAPQATRLVLGGREVNVLNGAHPTPGPVVFHYGGSVVTQQTEGGRIAYTVSDETAFGLRIESNAFRGFKTDRWFFNKANFNAGADERVECLAAFSY